MHLSGSLLGGVGRENYARFLGEEVNHHVP